MNLFRHYKGKLYKYRFKAVHSETLEEMVVYDCLYPNKLGQTWARPSELFFGEHELNGKSVPRFAKVELEIDQIEEVDSVAKERLIALLKITFEGSDHRRVEERLGQHSRIFLQIARMDGRDIGFKLGYAENNSTFYSWLGGILPEYRGLGVARYLMEQQHHWCMQNGFSKVQTKTKNRFRPMLLLNLKYGFDIVSTYVDREGELKIVLEKELGGAN